MNRERLIAEFGSHWQIEKSDEGYFVKEQPGRLDPEDDGDRRFNSCPHALAYAQAKEANTATAAVAHLRIEHYARQKSLWKAFKRLIRPHGAEAAATSDLRKRLVDAERRYAVVRDPDFTKTIVKVPLPDEVSVPECLPIGTDFWIVKADWMVDKDIRLHKATVASASFFPSLDKSRFEWTVRYHAEDEDGERDVSFGHSDIDPETGDVNLHIVGWTGHLSRDGAAARLKSIAEGLRKATDHALSLVQGDAVHG